MAKVALPEPPLAGQSSSSIWWQDPAGVEAAGFRGAVGLSVPHKPLSFLGGPVLHPVIRQIRHKGAAKDQDCGEDKKDDDPEVTEAHNNVLIESVVRFLERFVTSRSGSPAARRHFRRLFSRRRCLGARSLAGVWFPRSAVEDEAPGRGVSGKENVRCVSGGWLGTCGCVGLT